MTSWTPHLFREAAKSQGVPTGAIQTLVDEGARLCANGIPVIFTLGHLAVICDVSYLYLRDVIARRFDPYRVFKIAKRSGGYRQITVPEASLMRVQKWIHQNILLRTAVGPVSTAYSPGSGPVSNAAQHCGCRWLVKVDVRRFFESISERQVYRVFRLIGYPALLSFELTRLCTRFSSGESKRHQRR
jgi:RNA-directed DNA polymerase